MKQNAYVFAFANCTDTDVCIVCHRLHEYPCAWLCVRMRARYCVCGMCLQKFSRHYRSDGVYIAARTHTPSDVWHFCWCARCKLEHSKFTARKFNSRILDSTCISFILNWIPITNQFYFIRISIFASIYETIILSSPCALQKFDNRCKLTVVSDFSVFDCEKEKKVAHNKSHSEHSHWNRLCFSGFISNEITKAKNKLKLFSSNFESQNRFKSTV